MDKKFSFKEIFQLALVLGIVYLAANGKDGWGWLTFVLLLTL